MSLLEPLSFVYVRFRSPSDTGYLSSTSSVETGGSFTIACESDRVCEDSCRESVREVERWYGTDVARARSSTYKGVVGILRGSGGGR